MTFRERFEGAERDRGRQEEDMTKLSEGQMAIRKELNLNVDMGVGRTSVSARRRSG